MDLKVNAEPGAVVAAADAPAAVAADAAAVPSDATAAPPPLVTDPRMRLFVFLLLMAAMFMATLDNQIVSTALPTIVGEFGELERFGWVGSAYLLGTSAVMPLYGKLGDLFGRKYVIIAAVLIFTVGSLVCGLAVSMDTLIAARVLQALGGGGIMVSIFSINADLFAPRERARYQSYASLVIMASGSVGPVIGGTMSDLFGWRSIFLINLPIGIAVLAGLVLLLPYRKPHRKPKIDFAGALLLAGAVSSIVLWADSASLFGSLVSPVSVGILCGGALCALLFVLVERRVPEPIIPLALFSNPTFSLLLFISLIAGGFGIGMVNYLALYLQTTTGLSPTAAGLLFIAVTGGIATGSILTGRLIARSGRYKRYSVISMAGAVCSMTIFAFLPVSAPLYVIAAAMLFQGLSVGIGQQVPVIGVQNAARAGDVGAATGAVTLTRMAGAAIAISMYGAIISAQLSSPLLAIPGVADIATLTPKMIAELPEASRHIVATTYAGAFGPLFLAAAFNCLLGLVAALLLKNVQLPKPEVRKG